MTSITPNRGPAWFSSDWFLANKGHTEQGDPVRELTS